MDGEERGLSFLKTGSGSHTALRVRDRDVPSEGLAEAEGREDSTPSSRMAAWSYLWKHLGMDHDDLQLRLEQTPAKDLSDAELKAELARVRSELAAIDGMH